MPLEVWQDVVGRGQGVRRALEVPNQGKGEPAVTTAVTEVREHGHPHEEEDREHLEEMCVPPTRRLGPKKKTCSPPCRGGGGGCGPIRFLDCCRISSFVYFFWV